MIKKLAKNVECQSLTRYPVLNTYTIARATRSPQNQQKWRSFLVNTPVFKNTACEQEQTNCSILCVEIAVLKIIFIFVYLKRKLILLNISFFVRLLVQKR